MEIIKNYSCQTSDTIGKYFKEVRNSELISIDKEIELANRIKNNDKEAIDELVKANLKFVISVAREYQGLGLSLADLISEGNYGLIKAATKFDVTRGFRFISYAVYWIKQTILQSINDNSRTIRLPTNVINKISKTNKEFAGLDDSDKKVYPFCVSLNDSIKKNNGDFNSVGTELEDLLCDEESQDFDIFNIEIDKLKLALNNTLSILNKRERGIIECYFGFNSVYEPMTLEAIGDKYDLTKERVRQIKEKALRRLRHNNDELYLLLNH